MCLINEQIWTMVGHSFLNGAATLASNGACCDDHVAPTEECINVGNVFGDVPECSHDWLSCMRRQYGTLLLLEDAKGQKLVSDLSSQRVCRNYNQQARTALRDQYRQHRLSLACAGWHDDSGWSIRHRPVCMDRVNCTDLWGAEPPPILV